PTLEAFGSRQEDERAVGPLGQGEEAVLLVAKEALEGRLLRGLVDSPVRPLEPAPQLVGQVSVAHELAAVDEVLSQVADGALDLALRLGPIGATGPGPKAPVRGKTQEFLVLDQPASAQPVVSADDGLHLVEEELFGHAADEGKGRLEHTEQGAHVLLLVEAHPKQARVAEHDQERMPLAPGEAKLGKVHLGLAARRRLEADSHLLGRLWPHLAYVVAKLRVAARIAQSPDLLQQ